LHSDKDHQVVILLLLI